MSLVNQKQIKNITAITTLDWLPAESWLMLIDALRRNEENPREQQGPQAPTSQPRALAASSGDRSVSSSSCLYFVQTDRISTGTDSNTELADQRSCQTKGCRLPSTRCLGLKTCHNPSRVLLHRNSIKCHELSEHSEPGVFHVS